MENENKKWEDIKNDYLKKVEKALASVKHPQKNQILADVTSHLDKRFRDLPPQDQDWEHFQQIITEMGPPSDYVDLLEPNGDSSKQIKKQLVIKYPDNRIEFKCESCEHKILTRQELSGNTVKCQKCGQSNIVPDLENAQIIEKAENDTKEQAKSKISQANDQPKQFQRSNNALLYSGLFIIVMLAALCPWLVLHLYYKPKLDTLYKAEIVDIKKEIANTDSELNNIFDRLEYDQQSLQELKLAKDNLLTEREKIIALLTEQNTAIEQLKKANASLETKFENLRNKTISVQKQNSEIQTDVKPDIIQKQTPVENNFPPPNQNIFFWDSPFHITSYRKPNGGFMDLVNYPFVDDPKVIGTWFSIDSVNHPKEFIPGKKRFKGDLFLKKLTFLPKGKMLHYKAGWTKGLVLGDETASRYIIKQISGAVYMFFEWKSGDYTIRGNAPAYYVLRKQRM